MRSSKKDIKLMRWIHFWYSCRSVSKENQNANGLQYNNGIKVEVCENCILFSIQLEISMAVKNILIKQLVLCLWKTRKSQSSFRKLGKIL